jgi:pilus assembly protein FimV
VAPTEAPAAAEAPANVRVKAGDTLSGIASRVSQPGVSLDQMLVGLYRANPKAFLGDNMNRLKAGVVLNVPDADTAKSVSQAEARKIIMAQSADFSAYRERLAGAVTATTPEQPQRQAQGKVEAEVQDRKQATAQAPDKLTLSKGGLSSHAPAAEDRLAKSRAKEEGSARVAELSKNLDELRKLKEQAPASKPVPAKPEAAKPEPVAPSKPAAVVPPPVVPSAPAPAPAPAPEMAKPSEPASVPAPAVVVDEHASAASEPASAAATGVADEASAPASAPPMRPHLPIAPPPAPEPESPGFLESLNPMLIAAGGAVVALLAGLGLYVRSRRRADTGETSFLESRLQPDSFFGASGGQRVDTRDATGGPSSMSYSLSQLDAIGDVDPVAEADVYLAYGRDLQAEEILKEALRATPDRLAVRVKLLEVYAKRRDTKGYEQLAAQLYSLTNGQGEEWAKAQEMGLGIDPENPLYQPGGQPSEAPLSMGVPDNDMLGASTVPHSVMPTPSTLDTLPPAAVAATAAAVSEPAPAPVPEEVPASLVDLDLDISAPAPFDEVTDSVSPPTTAAGDLPPLDLPDLDTTVIEPKASAPTAPMDLPTVGAEAEAKSDDGGLDFDLGGDAPAAAPAPAAPSFDLDSLSLDLDAGAQTQEAAPAPAEEDWLGGDTAAQEAPADPMARKFELAEEFRQIGDIDGARELLGEVLENAQDGPLKAKAQAMLDSLG